MKDAFEENRLSVMRKSLIQFLKLPIIASLTLMWLARANGDPSWVPPHFSIPPDTISPNGRYGVMLPDYDTDGANQLVDLKTGAVLATLAGVPGSAGGEREMRWGAMEAKWSADSSLLCWIHPDKWFETSYVVLKLREGHLAWQTELMKPADREILARTEAAAPLNFALAKHDNAGDGSAYPEGFTIDVSVPDKNFSLPLTCRVSLVSNPKLDDESVDIIRSLLSITVGKDGSLTYSHFKATPSPLDDDAAETVKKQTVKMPLIDTDLGKAMLFPGLSSNDGEYAVGWTVQTAMKGVPPVDWNHWDAADMDKVLRNYDWQHYYDTVPIPYKAVNFVLNLHTGKTTELATENPNWPGKRDSWEMAVNWSSATGGQRFGLIENGQEDTIANFWLVVPNEKQVLVRDITKAMRQAVDALLRARRPEVAASDFEVTFPLKAGEVTANQNGLALISFAAKAPVSDQGEFQLSGTVSVRLSDGIVLGASTTQKRLDPFETNEALKKADATLNTLYQAAIKSLPPDQAQEFKHTELDWIAKRDADASQAVNITPDGSSQEVYEAAREKSLLDSTTKRIKELQQANH